MNKLSFLTPLIVLLIGLILLSSVWWWSAEQSIIYRDKSLDQTIDQLELKTRVDYDLFLKTDSIIDEERVSWRIIHPEGKKTHDFQSATVYTFDVPGKYIIEAYKNLKFITKDTVHIGQSAFAEIDIPFSSQEFEIGEEFTAQIRYEGELDSISWEIFRDDKLIEAFNGDSLAWTPKKSGSYEIALLARIDDQDFSDKKGFNVKEKPKKVVRQVTPTVDNSAERERQRRLAEERRKKEADRKAALEAEKEEENKLGSGWIQNFLGFNKVNLGPPSPERSAVNFKSGKTVILLKPNTNLSILSFEYFGNYKNGNYSITYECTSCEDAREKKLGPFKFTVTRDDSKSVRQSLASKPLGFVAGHSYRITIETSPGVEMGFLTLNQSTYSNADIEQLQIQGGQSQVFNIDFEKK